MKPLSRNRFAAAMVLLACSAANAQGLQRVGVDVQPEAAPKFADAPPAKSSVQPAPQAGAAMPTPLPSGTPMRADLVTEGLNKIAPLTPEEVLKLRKALSERAAAATQPLTPPAKPAIRTVPVDLGPSAMPEVIRVSPTEGATLNFMDAAGRPWKVIGADNFNTSGLDIGRAGPYGIVISAKMAETFGNVSIRLEDLVSPITVKVIAGPGNLEVDYSVGLQVPKYLPGEAAPVRGVVSQLALGVDDLMNYLMKTPPKDAKALTVDGLPGAMAWQTVSGKLILRTVHLAVSPNFTRRQSSFDGMTVYEMPVTPYVLVSIDGTLSNVRISGFSSAQQEVSKQ